MIVYLAGGMRSEWRERVKREVPGPIYLDPTQHGLENPAQYTAWDIEAITASDIVFAYFEAENPFGFNMAYEMGYAEALGKTILFVQEKFGRGATRPISMLIAQSFLTAETLDKGITALQQEVAAA